jgi:molybdate transport system substrate-binding protein
VAPGGFEVVVDEAGSARVRVLSTLAVQGAMPALRARFEQRTGTALVIDFAPTNAIMAKIEAGEAADIAILTREGIDTLVERGVLAGRSIVDLARSYVGIAVRAGSAKPDVGSVEALKAALLQAKSIAYSRIGASGIFFAGLIERLGIADAVNAKATIVPSGFTAELVARGETELAVQQVSELMVVPGVDVVGPLPMELQSPVTFSAAMFASAQQPERAAGLLRLLSSPEAASAFEAAGLEAVWSQRT